MDVIAICHMHGSFDTTDKGTIIYEDGESHAIDIDMHGDLTFNDLKEEVAELFKTDARYIPQFKYFLPGDRKTLITISSDKDLKRMMKYHVSSQTVHLYVE
ncbi:hypothetical protein M5689_008626 [Euphorbia peplus]|nr:hypothetical protein M5689_008626 [Euphorbia peplus]